MFAIFSVPKSRSAAAASPAHPDDCGEAGAGVLVVQCQVERWGAGTNIRQGEEIHLHSIPASQHSSNVSSSELAAGQENNGCTRRQWTVKQPFIATFLV